MTDKEQCQQGHAMLTRLGAPTGGSIRERLDFLLMEFIDRGRPLPTCKQVIYARFGPKTRRIDEPLD